IGDRRVRTDDAGEETSGVRALELRDLRATFVDHPDARCCRLKAADHQANGVDEMRPQQAEWITIVAADQSFDLCLQVTITGAGAFAPAAHSCRRLRATRFLTTRHGGPLALVSENRARSADRRRECATSSAGSPPRNRSRRVP